MTAMLTAEEARRLLEYDPATGVFIWRHRQISDFAGMAWYRRWSNGYAGKPAGRTLSTGYREIRLSSRGWLAHRLAWLLTYGYWPGEVDHINGDAADNRLANLREVTHRTNQRNRGLNKNNTSGACGVHLSSRTGRWCASIGGGYAKTNLGEFETKEEAIAARRQAEALRGYHKNHGQRPSTARAPTSAEREMR